MKTLTPIEQRMRLPQNRGVVAHEIRTPSGQLCRLADFYAIREAAAAGRITAPEARIELPAISDADPALHEEACARILLDFTERLRSCLKNVEFTDIAVDIEEIEIDGKRYQIGNAKKELIAKLIEVTNYGYGIGIFNQSIEVKYDGERVKVKADCLYLLLSTINRMMKAGIRLPEENMLNRLPVMRMHMKYIGLSGIYIAENAGLYIYQNRTNKRPVLGMDPTGQIQFLSEKEKELFSGLVVVREVTEP